MCPPLRRPPGEPRGGPRRGGEPPPQRGPIGPFVPALELGAEGEDLAASRADLALSLGFGVVWHVRPKVEVGLGGLWGLTPAAPRAGLVRMSTWEYNLFGEAGDPD